VRGPIPNSVVHVKGKEYKIWHRVNDKLLTIKEAKALGKEYEDKGYEVKLSLSEF
jgi:predicted esterase